MPQFLFSSYFRLAYSLLLIIFGHVSFALRCYQGVQTINAPLNVTSMDCPMPTMLTCTKTVDPRSGLITRGCSSGNCTINSSDSSTQVSVVPVCVNNTNTQSTFCCCYGDGCNLAPISNIISYRVLLFISFLLFIWYNF